MKDFIVDGGILMKYMIDKYCSSTVATSCQMGGCISSSHKLKLYNAATKNKFAIPM
jgi:hypothetical protein